MILLLGLASSTLQIVSQWPTLASSTIFCRLSSQSSEHCLNLSIDLKIFHSRKINLSENLQTNPLGLSLDHDVVGTGPNQCVHWGEQIRPGCFESPNDGSQRVLKQISAFANAFCAMDWTNYRQQRKQQQWKGHGFFNGFSSSDWLKSLWRQRENGVLSMVFAKRKHKGPIRVFSLEAFWGRISHSSCARFHGDAAMLLIWPIYLFLEERKTKNCQIKYLSSLHSLGYGEQPRGNGAEKANLLMVHKRPVFSLDHGIMKRFRQELSGNIFFTVSIFIF